MIAGLLLAAATAGIHGSRMAGAALFTTADIPPLIVLALLIVGVVAGLWKVLAKAGRPGWHALVPLYNFIEVLRIIDQPWWWIIGSAVPAAVSRFFPKQWQFSIALVSYFFLLLIFVGLARAFGRSWMFGVCMVGFAPILLPVLGFGKSQYHGPRGPIREPKRGQKPRRVGRLEAWAKAREGGQPAAPADGRRPRPKPVGPNPNRSKKRGRGKVR